MGEALFSLIFVPLSNANHSMMLIFKTRDVVSFISVSREIKYCSVIVYKLL